MNKLASYWQRIKCHLHMLRSEYIAGATTFFVALSIVVAWHNSKDAIYVDSRPWLSISFPEVEKYTNSSFVRSDIFVTRNIRNGGGSPATDVSIGMRLFPQFESNERNLEEKYRSIGAAGVQIEKEIDIICEDLENLDEAASTRSKFSRYRRIPDISAGIEPESIRDEITVWSKELDYRGIRKFDDRKMDITTMWLTVIGCIRYSSVLRDEFHTSRFAFDLVRLAETENCRLPVGESVSDLDNAIRTYKFTEYAGNVGETCLISVALSNSQN